MATVAIQTIGPFKTNSSKNKIKPQNDSHPKRPFVLNTCHAWSTDSIVVKEHEPDFYTGDDVKN